MHALWSYIIRVVISEGIFGSRLQANWEPGKEGQANQKVRTKVQVRSEV